MVLLIKFVSYFLIDLLVFNKISWIMNIELTVMIAFILIQLTYQLRCKLVIGYLTSLWESHKFQFIVQFRWTFLHVWFVFDCVTSITYICLLSIIPEHILNRKVYSFEILRNTSLSHLVAFKLVLEMSLNKCSMNENMSNEIVWHNTVHGF